MAPSYGRHLPGTPTSPPPLAGCCSTISRVPAREPRTVNDANAMSETSTGKTD